MFYETRILLALADGSVKKQFKFEEPLTKIEKLPKGIIICTEGGTPEGKLLGVYYND